MRGRVEVRARGKTSYLEEGMTFGEMVLFGTSGGIELMGKWIKND